MAKVWKYIIVTVGLILILRLAGLPTGADPLFRLMGISFDATGNFANVTTTATGFYDVLFKNTGDLLGILITIVAATAGVIAGLLTRAKPENLILLPVIKTT